MRPSPTQRPPREVARIDAAADKPYFRATLAEHQASQFAVDRPGEALLRDFLGHDEPLVCLTEYFPTYELPQLHRAVRTCFPQWQSVQQGSPPAYSKVGVPALYSVAVRPGRTEHFLADGCELYDCPNQRRRVTMFNSHRDRWGTELCWSLVGPAAEQARVAREWARLRRWLRHGPHYLCGQAIRPDGTLLATRQRLDWDDVVLDEATLRLVRQHTVDFLAQRELFRKNRIPQRRGIVLHGPPGTGKTTLGKVLAAQAGATFLAAGASDLQEIDDVTRLFEFARRLRPALLFFEDLDLYAAQRDYNARPHILSELLNELDGLKANDGLIVIATTNDLTAIEPALVERPSRFDVVIRIDLPGPEVRVRLLRRFFRAARVADADVQAAAERAQGASGAQLQEIAVRAVQRAILAGAVDAEGVAQVNADCLDQSLAEVLGPPEKTIGFAAAL